jgi:hypothetical protein
MKNVMTIVAATVALSTVIANPARAEEKIEIVKFNVLRFGSTETILYATLKNNTAESTGGGLGGGSYWIYNRSEGKTKEGAWVKGGGLPAISAGGVQTLKVSIPPNARKGTYEITVSYKGSNTSAKATLPVGKTALSLISLKCKKANEDDGTDRAELRVNMGRASKNFKENRIISTGKTAKLNGDCGEILDGGVTVELWEINPELFAKDVKIGVVHIPQLEVGEKTVDVKSSAGWYVLKYRVDTK